MKLFTNYDEDIQNLKRATDDNSVLIQTHELSIRDLTGKSLMLSSEIGDIKSIISKKTPASQDDLMEEIKKLKLANVELEAKVGTLWLLLTKESPKKEIVLNKKGSLLKKRGLV